MAITTGVAILYLLSATKMYSAEADLLVTPINSSDSTLGSLGLIQASTDPTRDVETASKLVTNIDVARQVQQQLKTSETPQELLSKVSAEPVAQSNVVAVSATDSSPSFAKELADSFATQAVGERTNQLHATLDQTIPRVEKQLKAAPSDTLSASLATLETLRSAPDPTIRVETLADEPTSPVSPKPTLTLAGGIFGGLILGIAAAFAAQGLDPRLRREEQLRRRYRLPILARIPKETGAKVGKAPISPRDMSSAASEAYRTLRATLTISGSAPPGGGQVILVTGSSVSEGKTTTALNLAASLALAGKRTILIESDLRRPCLGRVLGTGPVQRGVVSTLIENTTLPEALTTTSTYGPNLQLLLADYEGGWIAELFSIPAAQRMIEDARRMADVVVIDSAPLTEVVDALPLAKAADDVVVVVRLGQSRLDRIAQLAELLAENSIRPSGFTVIAAPRQDQAHQYYSGGAGGGDSGNGARSRRRGGRQRSSAQQPG